MTLRILLVDDEALARSRLKNLLLDCANPAVVLAGEAASTVQAVDFLQHHAVDAVLADIHMPGADGLTLATTLRQRAKPIALVFITAYAEHAVQAFELDALDYLTKPVRLERLQIALQKIERFVHMQQASEPDSSSGFLVIQERNRTLRVPLDEVLYFKAELKYITVQTAAHSYLLEGSLTELEQKYASQFVRIHRNTLIAKHAVRALQKHHDATEGDVWAVRLQGLDERLPVSRRQLANVRALVGQAAE